MVRDGTSACPPDEVNANARRGALESWTPGTPSMSLRIARPCQRTLVASGKSLWKSTMRRSPAAARKAVPGHGVAEPPTSARPRTQIKGDWLRSQRQAAWRRWTPEAPAEATPVGRTPTSGAGPLQAATPRAAPVPTTETTNCRPCQVHLAALPSCGSRTEMRPLDHEGQEEPMKVLQEGDVGGNTGDLDRFFIP